MPNYGPYGNPGGLPAFSGGIDDGDSLRLEGFSANTITGGWFPAVRAGRYAVENESAFRYSYARPQQVTIPTSVEGEQLLTVPLPYAGFDLRCLTAAPVLICDGAGTPFTPVTQNVRFGVPVPPDSVCAASGFASASGFVSTDYLLDPSSTNQISGLAPGDPLWWFPTFGGAVLEVRRSRNARSFDVLADQDALLYQVETPDRLSDDRSYCVDERYGLVYGRIPSETLPPPPFSTGQNAMTYVTVAYPTECDGALESAGISDAGSTYWQSYFSSHADFFSAFSGNPVYYDPLRLEEISVVDRDGLVRLRRTGLLETADLDGTYGPTASFLAPSGFVTVAASGVVGNTFAVLAADPSQDGALAPLPYGTTVVSRYWLKNSFCVESLSGSPSAASGQVSLNVRILTQTDPPDTDGFLLYETDPGGLCLPALRNTGTPDVNPLNRAVGNGFYWIEDSLQPVPVPPASGGRLDASTLHPYYDVTTGQGEEFTVRGIAYDGTGSAIAGIPLQLASSPGMVLVSTPLTSALNGESLFRVRFGPSPTGGNAAGLQGRTLSLYDNRNMSAALATVHLAPALFRGGFQPWEPSVFVCLGEDYQNAGSGTESVTQRYVRVMILNADGFPWGKGQSVRGGPSARGTLVLISQLSGFTDPGGGNTALGSQVSLSYDTQSGLLSDSGILCVGYAPVPGDTLTAVFYVGDDKYESAPILVR